MRWQNRAALVGWCLGPVLGALAGCSSVVPDALRAEVDPRLMYAQFAGDPDHYRGRLVLVGGEVLRVQPTGRDLELTLAERPLSPLDESPLLSRASQGDVVVLVPGAARAGFREGQVLTVVGAVMGRESPADPQSPPRLEARHIYVWAVGSPRPFAGEPLW